MKTKRKQSGISLIETTVVVAVVATLAVLSTPAINAFFDSLASAGNVKTMISAAMTTARAIAAKEQRYAGIRFQKMYNPLGASKASQYMIFIVHDFDATGLVGGFRAVDGIKPIKLPDTLGVMDIKVRMNITPTNSSNGTAEDTADRFVIEADLDVDMRIDDMCAFSIIFSPSGKMVIHEVRLRNRDGYFQAATPAESMDDIFNGLVNVRDNGLGIFVQDDYSELGLGAEFSRNNFVIYETSQFETMDAAQRYDYLVNQLVPVYINPYTGTIISTDR